MNEQLEIFEETKQPPVAQRKKARLPSAENAKGYNIVDGYGEKLIHKTEKPHSCRICSKEIPVGSSAIELVEEIGGKLQVHNPEYKHTKGQCGPKPN